MDELMEVLTLIQTKKISKQLPIIIYGTDYWREIVDFEAMVKWGTISKEDLDLIHFSDDVDDAFPNDPAASVDTDCSLPSGHFFL